MSMVITCFNRENTNIGFVCKLKKKVTCMNYLKIEKGTYIFKECGMLKEGWPGMPIEEDGKPSLKKGNTSQFSNLAIEFKF